MGGCGRDGGGKGYIELEGVIMWMWSCRFEMGLVGFGEVRLAMKDVCGGGENDARASTTYYLTMARPRPLLTLAHAGGV